MKSLLISALTALLLTLTMPAFATGETEEPPEKVFEGCTPGYWKNHTDQWVTFTPDQPVDMFEIPAWLWMLMQNDTPMDLLKYRGGPGDDGAARILLRHAMAAMLNSRHPDINYQVGRREIQERVRDALTGDREDMLQAKAVFEFLNERGCPL
jgi:hypothetical protein